MLRQTAMTLTVATCCMLTMTACNRRDQGEKPAPELFMRGKELFARHCSGCHPDGENRIYPQKTLHRLDLKANGITSPTGIVAIMRNPGQGMKQFDRKTIPDLDAFAIAHYILATF